MPEISDNQIEIINEFHRGFLEPSIEVFKKHLDAEVAISAEFSSTVPDLEGFKGSHAVCALACTEGCKGYSLLVAPEELIATISDIIMGGAGVDVYKGSLTELEINASAGLFENFFDKIKESFKERYVKELSFSAIVPKFINKGMKGYEEAFTAGKFDVSVSYNLKINEHEFKLFLLSNSGELIDSLKNINLIVEIAPAPVDVQPMSLNLTPPTSNKMSTYDIRKLADIKIDISAELGKAKVSIKQVLSLVRGSILELDADEGADISVFANGSEVAKAQVVVVDGHFGIKITKILNPQERFKQI